MAGQQMRDTGMKNRRIIAISALLAAMICSGFTALAHEGATGIVKDRMDRFKQSNADIRAVARLAQSAQFDEIAEISQRMNLWANEMAEYFPLGSDGRPSEAAAEIWTEPEGFAAAITAYKQATEALMAAAAEENAMDVMRAFQATADSCKSCHRRYRY